MITRWSTAHGVVHVAVFTQKSQGVGSVTHVTVDTFLHGELVRSESAPLEKLAKALTTPRKLSGRYELTQATLALVTLEPLSQGLFDAVVDALWPRYVQQVRQPALQAA